MSFREKTAWISLLSMSGIYGVYYCLLIHPGPMNPGPRFGLLETIVAVVAVQVVLTVAAAIHAPRDARAPRDERETLIDLRATRTAYAGLATGVAVACFFGGFKPPVLFNTNALLLLLVVAEILRSGCQVVQYRRGV